MHLLQIFSCISWCWNEQSIYTGYAKQAKPLTLEEEGWSWNKKVLGDCNPHALLNAMIFMVGTYFALCSSDGHWQLHYSPCQIQLIDKPSERPYLLEGNKYAAICPPDFPNNAFYLTPLIKPSETHWFSCVPLGQNKLSNAIDSMSKQAGIQGYKTNHAFSMSATHLYSAGVKAIQVDIQPLTVAWIFLRHLYKEPLWRHGSYHTPCWTPSNQYSSFHGRHICW